MKTTNTINKENIDDNIKQIEIDLHFAKAQLEIGFKIIALIYLEKDHDKFPSRIAYQARPSYNKMDEIDKGAIKKYVDHLEKTLATLKAQRTVEITFDKKNEKDSKKDN